MNRTSNRASSMSLKCHEPTFGGSQTDPLPASHHISEGWNFEEFALSSGECLSRSQTGSAVFIGLENINPDNLTAAKKHQNKITEYRKMLLAWKAEGIITLAGYILGFPSDTPETIRRDIAIIQEELPLDVIEFFCLTPLPGSEDHQVLWKKGVAMDPDLNTYDVEHVCTAHPKMSKQEWEDIYREAWSLYYTPKHMKTLLRRAAATGVPMGSLVKVLVTFATTVCLENVHPLQNGILRVKRLSERRLACRET
jgi:hypothetical protein